MRTKPKFTEGQIVDTDAYIQPMKIISFWWEDKTYASKNGAWVYRVGFVTQAGEVDKRKHFRQFEESRLTLIP